MQIVGRSKTRKYIKDINITKGLQTKEVVDNHDYARTEQKQHIEEVINRLLLLYTVGFCPVYRDRKHANVYKYIGISFAIEILFYIICRNRLFNKIKYFFFFRVLIKDFKEHKWRLILYFSTNHLNLSVSISDYKINFPQRYKVILYRIIHLQT